MKDRRMNDKGVNGQGLRMRFRLRPNLRQYRYQSLCYAGGDGSSADAERARTMTHQVLAPNVTSSIENISECSKGKEWQGAVGLLQEMVH